MSKLTLDNSSKDISHTPGHEIHPTGTETSETSLDGSSSSNPSTVPHSPIMLTQAFGYYHPF